MRTPTEIVTIPLEGGAPQKGGGAGAHALAMAWSSYLDRRGVCTSISAVNTTPSRQPAQNRLSKYCQVLEALSLELAEMIRDQDRTLVVTADHATTPALVWALRMYRSGGRLGIIWIDAHPDIHTPETTLSGQFHGMSLAIILGQRVADDGDRPSQEADTWNREAVHVRRPTISATNVVLMGVRDVEPAERVVIDSLGLRQVSVAAIRDDPRSAARSALALIGDCDEIVVSFDIDVIDANSVAGTASPSWFGPGLTEVAIMLHELLCDKRIRLLEVTEYNPRFATGTLSLHQIASLLSYACAGRA